MQIKIPYRRRFWVGALVASVGLGAIAGCHRNHGVRWSHGHHASFDMGFETPESAGQELQSRLQWVLRAIDADDTQKAQIQSIGNDAVMQLFPLMESHREHRRELVDVLTSKDVDREELHRLRQAEIEIADSLSREVADAMADIAALLTDAQRAELREHFARHL